MDKLVDAVTNTTINDIGYEVITAAANDAQADFLINSEKNIPTSKRDNNQKLFSSWTSGICYKDISVLVPPMDTKIGTKNHPDLLIQKGVMQESQEFQLPALQGISWTRLQT